MQTQQPKVTLINWTPRPLETVAWTCWIYNNPPLASLDALKDIGLGTEEALRKFMAKFIQEPTQPFMEYVQMVFLIENASRAFQQQITRHRMASFAIQSLRVTDMGKFADEGRYTMPSTVKDKGNFHTTMESIQQRYNELMQGPTPNDRENAEDARGILPLNIHSPITMRVDFNALRHVLQGRLCLTAQEEARRVGYLMKKEVHAKLGDWFGDLLQPPCHKIYGGKCTRMQYYCGVPLWLASTAPEKFKEWGDKHDWKPDHSRVPTNTVILPEDIEQIQLAAKKEELTNA